MRVARVGYLFAIGAILAFATAGAAPAAPAPGAGTPSFKVTISPEYTTAGQPTTFQVRVVNTSSENTVLGSVKITPPRGFAPPRPVRGTPLRAKTKVQNRTLLLHRVAIKPGAMARLAITATAPQKCGRAVLHWSSRRPSKARPALETSSHSTLH